MGQCSKKYFQTCTFTHITTRLVNRHVVLFQTLCISVSVLTLSAISVERWYAICHPLSFHGTARRARVSIAFIWGISCLVACPELLSSTVVPARSDTVIHSICYPALWKESDVMIFQICLMVGLYFLPLMLMGFTYTHIALVLWKSTSIGGVELRKFCFIYWTTCWTS